MTTTPDARAAIALLSNVVDERDAALATSDALRTQLADSLAKCDALTKKVRELSPPVVMFGCSVADPVLGTPPVLRTYSPPGRGMAQPPTDVPSVYSCKDFDPVAIDSYVKRALPGQVVAIYHEPEDNIESGKLTAERWVSYQLALCDAIKRAGRIGEVIPAVVLMAWTISNRPAMLPALFTAPLVAALKECGGMIGWDAYSGSKTGAVPRATPAKLLDPLAAYAKSVGLPWAVTETGTVQDSTTDGAAHAAWWSGVFDYARAMPVPPRFFLAWNSADSAFAFQTLPAVAAVWRTAFESSRR